MSRDIFHFSALTIIVENAVIKPILGRASAHTYYTNVNRNETFPLIC